MADLRRTPSLQHAVALIQPTVDETVFEMEKLDRARIPFSLNPGRRMLKPLMEGRALDWVTGQLRLDPHEENVQPNVDLVTAFDVYATGKKVPWFRECDTYGYPIGAGVIIPVRPAGFWGEGGHPHVLWPQCWKGRTLNPLQRAIFHTILRQTFFVGDFAEAVLEFVDLREQHPRAGRGVEVLAGADLGSVDAAELAQYLGILLGAFERHSVTRAARKAEEKAKRRPKDMGPTLFDPPMGEE